MSVTRYRIPLVPATASGATAFSTSLVHGGGLLEAVRLERPTTNQLATTVNLTITGERSGIVLFNATATSTGSQTWLPRTALVDASGAALGYTSAATPPPLVGRIPIGHDERIRVVVASGGANTSGVLHLYVSGG